MFDASVCYTVQVQYLLLGQKSGLVPADTLPPAPQWTCYAGHPAAEPGSNIWENKSNQKYDNVTGTIHN